MIDLRYQINKHSGLHKTIYKYHLITIYMKILMQDLFEEKFIFEFVVLCQLNITTIEFSKDEIN